MNLLIDYPTYVDIDASRCVATLKVADANGKEISLVFASSTPLFFGTEEEYLTKLDESE